MVCLAEEVRFTRDVEQLLERRGDLAQFRAQLEQQLEQFTQARLDQPLAELKLKALVLDIIHHLKIVDTLLASADK